MQKRFLVLVLTAAMVVGASIPINARQPFSAQIQQAINQITNGMITFVTLGMNASSYINWGTGRQASGYGFRDLAGVIQVKNSGGAWAPFITAGGSIPASTCAAPALGETGATTTGIAFTATPSILNCISGTAVTTLTATSWTSTVPLTENSLALVTTSTDGIIATNTTASTVGVPVQISPRTRWSGTAWDLDDAVSRTVSFFSEVAPASANTVSGVWRLGFIDPVSAAITYTFQASSGGSVFIPNNAGYLSVGRGGLLVGTTGNGLHSITNAAMDAGVGLDVATDGILKVRNRAQNADAALTASTVTVSGNFALARAAWTNTAPSGPVACTSPTVTWSNGTASFQIDVGTTCAGISTLVVTLPATTNAYSCVATNTTTSATAEVEMTASATTSATFTNYTRTTGIALAWVDGADIRISCTAG